MSAIDAGWTCRMSGWGRLALLFLVISLAACSDDEAGQPPEMTGTEAKEMLNRYACNACHEVDEIRIGPSFRDIAVRYADDADRNEDWLVRKVVHGGAGSWGTVPMVSNPRTPEEDIRQIVHWIMSLEDPAP